MTDTGTFEKTGTHTSFCTVPYDHQGPCQDDDGNDRLEPEDQRVAIPENYYALLQEAVNDLYGKVCGEGQELVEFHKEHKIPTAVFRPAYEVQTKRIGQAGMLMQWFKAGFKISDD